MFSGEKVLAETAKKILDGMSEKEKKYLESIISTLDFTQKPVKSG